MEDGKLFVKEEFSISLINNISGEKEREADFKAKDDSRFLDNLPIMYFEGKTYTVIDGSTGYVRRLERKFGKTK